MFCTGCGRQLDEDACFCPACGTATSRNQQAAHAPAPGRRLVRPMREKSIGGVCAGFANYLDVDIALMRVVWLCTAIFTGIGFVAYFVCWIVIPRDYGTESVAAPSPAPATAPPHAEPAGHPSPSGS